MNYGAMTPATSSLQADNERTRVTQWRLPPGGATGHHVHELDYVIVPVVAGVLTIVDDAGESCESKLQAGVSYFRRAGVSHNVLNKTDAEIVFVEVEIK